jgi:hypothetical protein
MIPRLLATVMLVAAMPATAEVPTPAVPVLTLAAESAVTAAPDVADIGAGVMTQASEAGAALEANSLAMNRVMAALKTAGIPERDIQTSGLSVQPQFRYQPNEVPVLTGFQASNRVEVRVRDPRAVGRVVDTLVKAGANQIDGPTFTIDKPEPLLDRARQDAVRLGRQRAELYATAAGLTVKRILRIDEGGQMDRPPMPMPRMAVAMDSAGAPPVAPGEVRLVARVGMTFELE